MATPPELDGGFSRPPGTSAPQEPPNQTASMAGLPASSQSPVTRLQKYPKPPSGQTLASPVIQSLGTRWRKQSWENARGQNSKRSESKRSESKRSEQQEVRTQCQRETIQALGRWDGRYGVPLLNSKYPQAGVASHTPPSPQTRAHTPYLF